MPMDAGDPGYGSRVAAAGPQSSRIVDVTESSPLLIPELPEKHVPWQPMTKEELKDRAGGPGWKKIRFRLVLLFWLSWLAMLGTAIAIIVKSPRPIATPLQWWQKSLFYQLQPALFMDSQPGSVGGIDAVCDRLSYIKSLGVGALILEGLFYKGPSPDGPVINDSLVTVPQMQQLLKESNKVGLRVVLDLCELDLDRPEHLEGNETSGSPEPVTTVQYALRSWLERGVAGFAICDKDPAYSERTLLEWRVVLQEFSRLNEERIVLVKETGDSLHHGNASGSINSTLVEMMMRSILPSTHHKLSAQEVAGAIEAKLRVATGDVWPSWMVGGKTSSGLQKLLLVLMMTLPGSPAIQYGEEISNTWNVSLNTAMAPNGDTSNSSTEKERHLALSLFKSLCLSKGREEALLNGNFSFLPFNTTTNATFSSSSSALAPPAFSAPILGFLRSWGCVQFLVVLNIGPDPHDLDPNWAQSLPNTGVFVVSTGMDRLGSVSLDALKLRPQEAVVIKLIEVRSYS